jgi:hypothetical protein
MQRMITKSLALVALVGGLMAFSTSKAEATLVAYICNDSACTGGGDLTTTDETGEVGLGVGIPGYINFGGVVGDYEITANIAQNLGNGLDLNYTATNRSGGVTGDVWLWVVDSGFTGPANIEGVLGGTHDGGTVTAYICGGDDNVQVTPDAGPCVSGFDAAGVPTSILLDKFATGGSYTYSIGVKINGLPAGSPTAPRTATGDFRTTIPEPASLSLLGLGLAGAAAARRRRA